MTDASQTFRRDDARGQRRRECAWLTWALACERPLATPMPTIVRWPLGAIDEVSFGRGKSDDFELADGRLVLRFADRAVSSSHASLVKELGGWVLVDHGSTNGSFVNDARVERVRLGDGDRIEIGHHFFVFREAEPSDAPAPRLDVPGLATWSPSLGARFAELARVAASDVPIVLGGESGTGKELMARAAHQLSGRRGPFVPVNCGALPTTLVQSELFGYKRGAFSGADEDRAGLVRSADRGTLFLDEVGDLPLASQAALLRVLQEKEVTPLGATKAIPVDVRVVAATHRDLPAMVAQKLFREDLWARLNGWSLRLPPLRERKEDLGLLMAKLLERGKPSVSLTWEAARALMRHDWPLNVRELEQALSTALVLSGGAIDVAHLPATVTTPASAAPAASEADLARLSPEDQKRREELRVLFESERGNVAAVARAMGKAPVQIRRWARRFGLEPEKFRR